MDLVFRFRSYQFDTRPPLKTTMSRDILLQLLNDHFGHQQFRSKEQEDAVKTLIDGKEDVFVNIPTGGGKSLIYQLPAVASINKVTIVVSPLIALIQDQLDQLVKTGIVGKTIHSKLSEIERKHVEDDLGAEHPTTRLLYVTAERCATRSFRDLLTLMMENNSLAYFVIDEAHCVSDWGNDFRPEYKKLGELRELTRGVSWAALTASASPETEQEIVNSLNFGGSYRSFKLPCLRSNLFYDVQFKDTLKVSIFVYGQGIFFIGSNPPLTPPPSPSLEK